MATITKFIWHEMEVDDPRDVREAKIRNKIVLKTSDRVTWTDLRKMRPVPQWKDSHPKEPGFYLDYIKPTHKSRHIWELECEYVPFGGGQIDPDPIARPPVVTFSSSLVEQPTLRDNKGRPIVNRAGEFIQGLMVRVPIIEYRFQKNFGFDPAWILTHMGAVNSDTVKIRGLTWRPKTLLLSGIDGGEFLTENRSTYTSISGTILADRRGWTQEVWNTGTVQLVQQPRVIKGVEKMVWVQVPITEGNPPDPVSQPVPLDEDGVMISDAYEPSRTEPLKKQNLISLKFDLQHEEAFARLPLL